MRNLLPPRSLATALLALLGAALPALAGGETLRFERDVLPILQSRCIGCHGAGQPQAGLDLRTLGDVLEGGHSGPSVIPGAPERSLLYRVVAEGKMPPGGGQLPPQEMARLAAWIRQGAAGNRSQGGHWAFRPPQRPVPPPVRHAERVRNPIDRFVLAELEKKGLTLSPEADRATLLRRVTFDLIGLPPTPEEVEAFIKDPAPDAYERVVDRLLADSRHGERWARHWLDTAGYADSEGVLEADVLRPNAWRYRDYVIRSLNRDKPYDQFLREQLAGDELVDYRNAKAFTPELIDTLAATGFLRTAVDATRIDFNPHQYGEYQYRMLHDVQTIAVTTVLGLTMQCARCHDHKYEPLSQRDYYRLQALFMGAVRPRGAKLPSADRQIIALTAAEHEQAKQTNASVEAALRELDQQQNRLVAEFRLRALEQSREKVPEAERTPLLEAARLEEAKRSAAQKALVQKHAALFQLSPEQLDQRFPEFRDQRAELQRRRAAEAARRVAIPTIRAFYDQDANPPATPLLIRGDWLRPGDPVEPGVPAVLDDPKNPFTLPPPGAHTTWRRKTFAEWVTRPDHPLTARVMVNRLWAHHFGVGIVPSVDNFGRSGTPPSHPELLDWLATELVRGADGARPWTLKALHRLMVTSATYRQASVYRPEAARIDPDGRLLWRQRPRRLEAEALRDAMLAVTGTLDGRPFGEPVPTEVRPTGEIVAAGETQGGRRSLYLLMRRSRPVTLLNIFDAPVMETHCTRRTTSTTATQALALMNSEFITSQGRHFSRRLLRERPPAAGARFPADPDTVDYAFRLAFSRPPSPRERVATLEFLRSQTERYRAVGQSPEAVLEAVYADLGQALLSANEFLYVD